MRDKLLKTGIITIILIIFLVSAVGAAEKSNDGSEVLSLSKGGLTIHYPSNWGYSPLLETDNPLNTSIFQMITVLKGNTRQSGLKRVVRLMLCYTAHL